MGLPRGAELWRRKFAVAFAGVVRGARGQSSFFVHLLFAAAVVILAACLQVSFTDWCLLLLCIFAVLTAEMFNTALEWICRAVTDQQDPRIANALDISSAAVLLGSLGSAIVGTLIFGRHLGTLLGWW